MYRQASTRVSPVHQYQARLWFHTRKIILRKGKKKVPLKTFTLVSHMENNSLTKNNKKKHKNYFEKKLSSKNKKVYLVKKKKKLTINSHNKNVLQQKKKRILEKKPKHFPLEKNRIPEK